MSKNATKLYIHVGYPKCASSFLQMEVFFKDKRIKFHGIIRDPDNSISFKKVKFNSLIDTFARYARGKTNFAPKSKDLFELMNHDINVISDEDFISNGIISVEDKALRIKNIFPSAEIIVVVRSPISFLKSLYYFYFRGGLINVGFNDWVNKEFLNYENSMNLQYFHYEKYIGIFVKNFGKDNVHVLNLEDLKYNSDAFLSSLYKIIGLKYLKKEKNIKKRNKTLSASGIQFGKKYPLIWRIRGYFPQPIRRIVRYILSTIKTQEEALNSSNVKRINKLYVNDIRYLENNFGIVFKEM